MDRIRSHFPYPMKSKPHHPSITPPSTPPPSSPPCYPNPKPQFNLKSETRRSLLLNGSWRPLPLTGSDLSIHLTLPTGQSFRWRRTSPTTFSGVIGPHLLSLRQLDPVLLPYPHLYFLLHNPPTDDPDFTSVESSILDYFNARIDIVEMWRGFAEADGRFAELVGKFDGGARVMRQDPVECLFQFLCSSNNNIGRIERMVEVLSSYGRLLGSVGGFEFYEFPTLERLGRVTEAELRVAGFGYRANYIVGAVKALQEKPGGGAQWLASLRDLELDEVIESLSTLPGVGPKVAACVALFSLDQHHAIPVDTHVWQIATRYLLPELAGKRLTPKLCRQVSEAFVSKFGKYAGWAQNVLFIGELPSQKALSAAIGEAKSTKRKRVRSES